MNKEQAEGVMTVLAEVVEESIKGMETTMVSKAEQEKVRPSSLHPCPMVSGFMDTEPLETDHGSNVIHKKWTLRNLNPNSNYTKRTISHL